MTSVSAEFKQSRGYFVVTGTKSTELTAWAVSVAASGAGGSATPAVMAGVTTLALVAGQVLKDMGKTITTGSVGQVATPTVAGVAGLPARVFRKVQLLNKATTSATTTTNVANGVGGSAPGGTGFLGTDVGVNGSGYNTFYIELPTNGTPVASVAGLSALIYIPGMPGLL